MIQLDLNKTKGEHDMIAIVSPSKTMKEEPVKVKTTTPHFIEDTKFLAKEMKNYDIKDLRKLMDISEDLATLNFERFQNFEDAEQYPATYLFRGDVFKGLDVDSLDEDDLTYLNDHLRILSGLYGVLRPLDNIKPYRLEMGTNISTERGKDLYDFWDDKVQKSLEKEAKDNILINLASKEYSKVIREKTIDLKVIDVDFKEYRKGEYKIIAFYAKVARGEMARFMAKNKVSTIEELKDFDYSGYSYNEKLSHEEKLVFTRES